MLKVYIFRTIPEDNEDVKDNCSAINDSPTLCLQFTHQLSVCLC